ncbi:hydantoinase/oxoprolinase family protein [Neobacillus niacini]|uniref:hydantoinase/oxoprolinase family protein n=1 Tax=Neobacillus niacini TaxID=86668 RepID=UPI0021CB8DBF|nr:hydantoinase/oxoprolinase family protein [Neobacillus niacini]MCM3766219.1 hydantoinase/oxoprolinase family protein [Neobacillus niacini]
MMKRISVDIGGTFTDCFLAWEDQYLETKALTTHHNLSLGFMDALKQGCDKLGLGVRTVLSQVSSVRYATTLGTNTLIERNGPSVGLLTTAGYESSVPLSRGRGYGEGLTPTEQANLPSAKRPEPIVPMRMIAGVRERIDYKGEVLLPLDEEDVRKQVRLLINRGAQVLVVSLMNSVANPIHEKRIEEIIIEEYPSNMLGAIPVILSHLVVNRKGEYVRTTATILDAYLHGQMFHALSTLELALKENGYTKPMQVVHNSGGMAQLNSTHSLQTINSGPIAGIDAAEVIAEQFKLNKLICMDIGGTSCDIGLVVKDGTRFYDFNPVIDRWLVNIPMVNLKIIGAGGGSIARLDKIFNTIEVGPNSAGSDPGPACYDRGGLEPTVTDADLLLGYLDPDHYAGGTIKLNKKRSELVVSDNISEEMDISIIDAAKQIKEKVDSNMADAISTELRVKGYDPKSFTLLAYGGNGTLHCCGIADQLDINQILVPPFSPIFSALGAGMMSQLHIHEKNVYINIYDVNKRSLFQDYESINAIVEELESKGREDLLRQGVEERDIQFRLELDMRYGNQVIESSVICPISRLKNIDDVFQIISTFRENFRARFGEGSEMPEAGIRVSVIRVISYVQHEPIYFNKEITEKREQPVPVREQFCYFIDVEKPILTPVYDINRISEGTIIQGPALIDSSNTTYLIEPGWVLKMGIQGSALITRSNRKGQDKLLYREKYFSKGVTQG